MFPVDIWALVPHPAEPAVLVIETGSGFALPCATADSDDDTATRLAAVTAAGSIGSPFLRRVAAVRTPKRELVLKEFEAVPAAGRRWLALDELERLDLPAELRPGLDNWVEYQRGRPYSDYRPAWSRPGWFADTRDWLDEQLTHYGIAPSGEPGVVQQWAISAVLKQPTHGGGDYYLKSVFGSPGRAFWHEPALSAVLAREHPGLVPAVTMTDSDRGLMLMPDMGITYVDDHPAEQWGEGLRVLARIQRAWVGRRTELLELGCPERTLAATPDRLELAFADPLVTDQLDAAQLDRVAELMPRWRKLFDEATRWPVPLSLVHGDYHPGNVGLRPDGSACAFDWSDGAWSHPFLDAALYIRNSGAAKTRLWDVYLKHWTEFAPLPQLRRLIPAATILQLLYSTVTYHDILTNVDPDDRFVFSPWANTYWRLALEAWDEMS